MTIFILFVLILFLNAVSGTNKILFTSIYKSETSDDIYTKTNYICMAIDHYGKVIQCLFIKGELNL